MARSQAQIRVLGESTSVGSRVRQSYSDAFKADAVAKARSARSVAQVARTLGVARNTLRSWMEAAAPPPMSLIDAARSGNRKAYLQALRDELAEKIAAGMAARDMPPNVRLLNETMRELEEIALREVEDADAADAPDEALDPEDL